MSSNMELTARPRKRFAQHWLRSETALNNIVEAARLKKSDRLLEIGPGTGILTRRLLPEVQSVVAVEIDRDLCKKLVKSLGKVENFLLLQGDILSLDIESSLVDFPRFQNPNKVVANIPYNITGSILEKLLGTIANPTTKNYELIVLLLQKEVAERLTAKPGTKAYGALSVQVQYLANCELICDVPARDFYPPPKVDSTVIRLQPKVNDNPAKNPQFLQTLVKVGFANKRKMLRNNLKSMIDSDRLDRVFTQLNINPQSRAEELSLEEWINLSNCLSD
ncbi:16S rRNA (adenine(1518)-N(6)/adenine(1519)-N(6))-dimethyltransferase RsmA [Pleurocapsa sp. PCC 7327]|uniref:16S rRNA (adenine(1518)-N(6)/adenine(1519)-N(6))- dimethyltransferase RsmA n=1 Tax=Pleurocapsa sp. PCC 7327 TaxID=118163 RepID=UPI001C30CDCB|nr:16S rRNA (adenine(1518)-N(6)/adenine(1519)-N(6))-dimethyltransferase RsmA [Pleurocapsa sp. PCC 7327]